MLPGGNWNAVVAAIGSRPLIPWRSNAWRIHAQRYPAIDPGGSRLFSGRYHRAPDLFDGQRTWAALYLALDSAACIAEATRHAVELSELANRRVSEIEVSLSAVIDLRDPSIIGLTTDDLVDDHRYDLTQEIGLAALERGAEGLIVPAASLLGNNLVVLFENRRPGSRIEVRRFVDPRLLIDRSPST
jgi:RES domain-containing protein